MNKLIGIIGLKRSGKDTISDYLCKNYNFSKYSYADPIKRACKELFGFSDYQVFGDGKDEIDPVWGCTPRDILKILGTEIGQYDLAKYIPAFEKIGRLIWVKRFEQWYYVDDNSDKNIVISDVRFKHEAESIVSLGGEIWRVDRPGMNVGDFHASEKEMFEIEYKHLITNDGDLEDLYNKIQHVLDINKSYLITTELPEGITKFINGKPCHSTNKREVIPINSLVSDIKIYDGNGGGYTFTYNDNQYWTYYGWLFAENTEINKKLIIDIANKRLHQASLQEDINRDCKKLLIFQ